MIDAARDCLEWLASYQADNQDVWPEANELFQRATLLAGGKDLEVALIKPDGELFKQTQLRRRRLFESKVTMWLMDFCQTHPKLWPDFAELTLFAKNINPLDQIDSAEQWMAIQQAVRRETENLATPLEPMNEDVVPREWAEIAYPALQELLAVHSVSQDPRWQLQISFVDQDGLTVNKTPVDVDVYLKLKASKTGRLTIVQFDDYDFMVVPVDQSIQAGKELTLEKPAFGFSSPGIKQFYIYATDKPFADEVVFPLHNQQPLTQKWFETPRVHSRVERIVREGASYPDLPPSNRIHSWTRQTIAIEVQ